jgi:GNAT superfamily N-acetyltransferase
VIPVDDIEVRPMLAPDIPAVLRLAARLRPTVVQRFAPLWRRGEFEGSLVATLGDRVVAFARCTFPAFGECWWEGMLVDDRVRGRGLASAVCTSLVTLAEQHGSRVIRLSTANDNGAVRHICIDKFGFSEHSHWLRVHATPANLVAGWPAAKNATLTPSAAWRFMTRQDDRPVIWTSPADFSIQTEAGRDEASSLVKRKLYLARRRAGELDGVLLFAPGNQRNCPPNTLCVIYAAARSDRSLRMLLASAYAVASRRGQHLALMMPLHSVRLRNELGARLTASSTEWTELVLLAKDLAAFGSYATSVGEAKAAPATPAAIIDSGSSAGSASGETTRNDAQYGSR